MKDTHTLLLTMSEGNPFTESTYLRNSMTEVNATGDVDVCRAKEIGQKIMDSMTGIPVAQYTFKRSDQVTTLQSKSSVRIDPELLFQRLIAHPMPLTTEMRYSVSSCVATNQLSLTTHSCREHHRKPFW